MKDVYRNASGRNKEAFVQQNGEMIATFDVNIIQLYIIACTYFSSAIIPCFTTYVRRCFYPYIFQYNIKKCTVLYRYQLDRCVEAFNALTGQSLFLWHLSKPLFQHEE